MVSLGVRAFRDLLTAISSGIYSYKNRGKNDIYTNSEEIGFTGDNAVRVNISDTYMRVRDFVDKNDVFFPYEVAESLDISMFSAKRQIMFLSKTGVLEQVLVCRNCKRVMHSWELVCPQCNRKRQTRLAYKKKLIK